LKTNRKPAILVVLHRAAFGLLGLSLAACSSIKNHPDALVTTKVVDLGRYAGRWYEIARLPLFFQKANESAMAEYGSNPDGTASVHNIATRPDGTQHDIRGYAKVLNPPENTKLAVRFKTWFCPLIPVPQVGHYWILHVDELYQEAIVSTPDRKHLWFLARTATIADERYAALVARPEQLGFDVSSIIKDPQPSASNL
jgi:apolipoprotein D and lipocalin family protein